jgi:hypothetical protein
MMEALAAGNVDNDDDKDAEKELDLKMKEFEEPMDQRPFLVNYVLIVNSVSPLKHVYLNQ